MTGLKFELDVDEEIQKLGLLPAKPANSANRGFEISNFSKISNGADVKTIKPSQFDQAIKLFKERGWIQVWSTYLNESIYLTRHKSTQVPDPSLAKYTKDEVDALRGLSLDELKTLHEAKVLFRGNIFKKQRN